MNFLNPFFLFGSLALAVPVLIHLVRREKFSEIFIAALEQNRQITTIDHMPGRLQLFYLFGGNFASGFPQQGIHKQSTTHTNAAMNAPDGELDAATALDIERRIAADPALARQYESMVSVKQAVESLPRPEVSDEFSARIAALAGAPPLDTAGAHLLRSVRP